MFAKSARSSKKLLENALAPSQSPAAAALSISTNSLTAVLGPRRILNPARISADMGPRPAILPVDRTRHLDRPSGTSGLGFFIYAVVIGILFLRPAELIPALQGLPIYYFTILFCMVMAGPKLLQNFRVDVLKARPIQMCVVLFVVFAAISQLFHFYLGGVLDAVLTLPKPLILYGLTITYCDTPKRFTQCVAVFALMSTAMIALCTIDYLGIIDIPTIQQYSQNENDAEGRLKYVVLRLRGTGIFNDPNDLAMLVVITGTLCCGFLFDRRSTPLRFLWLLPIGVMGTALICTHSRGGLLAAGVAGLVLSLVRWGRKAMIAAAICGTIAVPLMAGRQTEIDLEEGTANERLLLWREGFDAIKSVDVFFGTGFNSYDEFAGLVAHNSFVHAFVELGLVGGTAFIGCFFFPFLAFYRSTRWKADRLHPRLHHWRPYMTAAAAGCCGSMFSLSRCYVEPTFLLFGLLTAIVHLIEHSGARRIQLVHWDKQDVKKLAMFSFGIFVFLYMFVKLFAY